jgi:hypothetical protein
MTTYFLTCTCGTAEVVGSPEGRCEGCGKPYSGLAPLPDFAYYREGRNKPNDEEQTESRRQL